MQLDDNYKVHRLFKKNIVRNTKLVWNAGNNFLRIIIQFTPTIKLKLFHEVNFRFAYSLIKNNFPRTFGSKQ